MTKTLPGLAACLGIALFATGLRAQEFGDAAHSHGGDERLLLTYASFDPTGGLPPVPAALKGGADTNLWIVQFHGTPSESGRSAVRSTGAQIHGFLPHDSYVVEMNSTVAGKVQSLPQIRWVGHYEPAFRLEPFLLAEFQAQRQVPERRYNILMVDKRRDKAALNAKIRALGGEIVDEHIGSPLFTVDLDFAELIAAARLDEVLWIDRWSAPEEDMNNVRIQGGANYVETQGGYTGSGIRGHVYEGVEATHADFSISMTNVRSSGAAQNHGHCTAGIVFGNGTSHANARGMAPDGRGYYTNYLSVSAGFSRNQVISDVVNVHNCMFTTASWGAARTLNYTSVSADADDIIFDHRIPWTQSQSNAGNQMSRPQAWAKNIFSIGGVRHFDNSNPGDDSWAAGNASTGPASDGRIKPDLASYYDLVWTSDRTGAAGYTNLNYFTGFNGTSAATPITAGHNALAIQMYTDLIFGNSPRVPLGTRFQNRPFAQTLKALMIVSAEQYPFNAGSADNRREHQGWGFPDLRNMYDRRNRTFIVPEDDALTQGQTASYTINVVPGEPELKICMTFLDPMGNPAAALARVNDLSLRVVSPSGTTYWGNNGLTSGNYSSAGGVANTVDTVECVFVQNPTAGNWRVEVVATTIVQDANLSTRVTDATYALVVGGGREQAGGGCDRFIPDSDPTTGAACNLIPFGDFSRFTLSTTYASNNGGSAGGAVYFDAASATDITVDGLAVNAWLTNVGDPVSVAIYRTSIGGTHVGNETNMALWTQVSSGTALAAAQDSPTTIDLTPFPLPTGTYGIAVVATGFGNRYTNGNNVYSDPNLTITTGSATNVPFTGTPFTPRTINMDLRYRTDGGTWTNQRYQTIMRSGDLGGPGVINGIGFAPCGTGTHWNRTLIIRMSHVPAGYTLTTSFAANLPAPVTVLSSRDYTWHLTVDTWNEVGLQNGFAYDGTSDVVVDILAEGNHTELTSGGIAFRRQTEPRVWASGWTGAPPATGSTGNAALKMRVNLACADMHTYGVACGTLQTGFTNLPILGSPFRITVNGATPGSLLLQLIGFGNGSPPYPAPLAPLPNCRLYHDIAASSGTVASAAGGAGVVYQFPNNPAFIGVRLYGSWVQLGPTFADWSLSDYIRILNGVMP